MTSEMAASRRILQWSSQLNVLPSTSTPALRGDKIILPPSALEQLLSASTTIRQADTSHRSSGYGGFFTSNAEQYAPSGLSERHQDLPHPLTFRLVNPQSGAVIFAGIREFSAEEGQVGLSPFLRRSLGLETKTEDAENEEHRITVHVQELQKGTYVKLRPLEAGYDPQDWKALLERFLRDNFTTLTHGEILTVSSGPEVFSFLVDELKPDNQAVTVVDTDLEVDIEALNEEQARETLNRRLEKRTVVPDATGGNSLDAVIDINKILSGQVIAGSFVNYTLKSRDAGRDLEIEVAGLSDEADVDLFVSPSGPKQQARPTYDEHVFADFSSNPTKRIKVVDTNAALDGSEALWISVSSFALPNQPTTPQTYELRVSTIDHENSDDNTMQIEEQSHTDETQCKNCRQWIPQQTLFLHENFCFRNNILCPHCSNVFQKSSQEWQNHWHCPHDSSYGNTPSSRIKHDNLIHTPQICKSCSFAAKNTPDLAHHRTTTCPEKPILCSFCHLIVPQQGPDDPDIHDPEVLLSGLTPHEVSDGARTTECHLCDKIVRLRDMPVHLKHHDLARISRTKPRLCRNANCGRLLDTVAPTGEVSLAPKKNELGICDTCFGPLYVSSYDPEGKALKRRVERRYLQQLLTGCNQPWCMNEYCKTGRLHRDPEGAGAAQQGVLTKEAMSMIKPFLERIWDLEGKDKEGSPLHFCVDEAGQRRRMVADGLATVHHDDDEKEQEGKGWDAEWWLAALGVAGDDVDKARTWLGNFAPRRGER